VLQVLLDIAAKQDFLGRCLPPARPQRDTGSSSIHVSGATPRMIGFGISPRRQHDDCNANRDQHSQRRTELP